MVNKSNKAITLLDSTDVNILCYLEQKSTATITDIREAVKLTHANLTNHMKRINRWIDRERDKQTINISLNKSGIKLLQLLYSSGKLLDIAYDLYYLDKNRLPEGLPGLPRHKVPKQLIPIPKPEEKKEALVVHSRKK